MGILRILILFFNVAVITFLISRMFDVVKQGIPKTKKAVIITAGIFLLIIPVAFIIGIIPLTPTFLLMYPVAVSFFIYLIRES
jgi:hypothetical protein